MIYVNFTPAILWNLLSHLRYIYFLGDIDAKGDVNPKVNITVPDAEIKAVTAADVEMPPPVVEEMVQAEGAEDVESGFGFSMPGLRVSV